MDNRPPIGITPKWAHDQHRLEELTAAITRYLEVGIVVPEEWIIERNELIEAEKKRKEHQPAFNFNDPWDIRYITEIRKDFGDCDESDYWKDRIVTFRGKHTGYVYTLQEIESKGGVAYFLDKPYAYEIYRVRNKSMLHFSIGDKFLSCAGNEVTITNFFLDKGGLKVGYTHSCGTGVCLVDEMLTRVDMA